MPRRLKKPCRRPSRFRLPPRLRLLPFWLVPSLPELLGMLDRLGAGLWG